MELQVPTSDAVWCYGADLRQTQLPLVITVEILRGGGAGLPQQGGLDVAGRLFRLVGLSEAMTTDATFARQARRKFVSSS